LLAFGRPVREFIAKNKHVETQNAARRELKRTMFSTLVGSSLTVVSSSLLYINILLWVLVKGPFGLVWLLNPLVFGVNIDSVLNDIGMLVLSGTAKEVLKGFKCRQSRSTRVGSDRIGRAGRVVTPLSKASGGSGRQNRHQPKDTKTKVTMLRDARPFGSQHLINAALKERTPDESPSKISSTSNASQPKADAWVLSSPTPSVEEHKASSSDPVSTEAVGAKSRIGERECKM
jgi:hypothetical protein